MSSTRPSLILASRSPRRRHLLEAAGYTFTIVEPDEAAEGPIDESLAPEQLVMALARDKAENVARQTTEGIVLGCDTVVACGGRLLGKPADREEAGSMLRLLRGELHQVYSGICLWKRPQNDIDCQFDVTHLRMQAISDAQLESYLDTGLWEGKAGAFGFQDRLGWIEIETGSESNVVGLPMELLRRMLAG